VGSPLRLAALMGKELRCIFLTYLQTLEMSAEIILTNTCYLLMRYRLQVLAYTRKNVFSCLE